MNEVIKTRRNKISTTMQLLNTKCTARPAHCLHPRNYVLCKLDHSKTVRLNSSATKTDVPMQQYDTLQSQAIAALYSPPPPVPSSHYIYCAAVDSLCVAKLDLLFVVIMTYLPTVRSLHRSGKQVVARRWEKAGLFQGRWEKAGLSQGCHANPPQNPKALCPLWGYLGKGTSLI
jgi:hypothetical protein